MESYWIKYPHFNNTEKYKQFFGKTIDVNYLVEYGLSIFVGGHDLVKAKGNHIGIALEDKIQI